MNGSWINKAEILSVIAKKLRTNFERWNYREILLPAVEEYRDELDKGTKFTDGKDYYVIKPDITSQLLTRLTGDGRHKLFYISEVLDGNPTGDWQFGAEYIGGNDRWMVVEIISTIITALESLGITEFYVDVGSKKVWERAIEGFEDIREEIFDAIHHRSFDLIDELDLPREEEEEVWGLFNYRSRRCDYERLNEILETIDDDRVVADFGTVRGMSYYEDLTFEIYSPEVGSPLGGGGEYKFRNRDAFGFAFHLDKLLEIFSDPSGEERLTLNGTSPETLKRAMTLVREGQGVEIKS